MLILVTHFFVSGDNADESLTMYGHKSSEKKLRLLVTVKEKGD